MTKSQVISDSDFAKLVKMTRLTLSDDEKISIHNQLDEALNAVKVFDELDLKDVAALSHPGNLQNIMREDNVGESFTQEEALSSAKSSDHGYFVVDSILEDQS